MTEQMAIECLEYLLSDCFYVKDYVNSREFLEASNVIRKALEEIQQYRAIGTVEELQALKEKSVAKKVKGKTHEYGNYFGRCPVCGASAVNEFSMPYKYCHDCGQHLSWE